MNFKFLSRISLVMTAVIAAWSVTLSAQEPAASPTPTTTTTAGSGMSARDMMAKFIHHFDNPDETTQSQMVLIAQSGSEQTRDLDTQRITGTDQLDKTLIRFRAPPDIRGTTLLTWEQAGDADDLQWIYLPAIRKAKQIAGGDKQDKFVGSDFTYEDLRPEKLDDNDYTLVSEDDQFAIIDAVPKNKDSAYGRRRLRLRKDNFFVVGVGYYDKSGKLVKVMTVEDLTPVAGGLWRANKLTMKDTQSGHSTVIRTSNRQLNTGLSDKDFSKQALERGQ